MKYFIFVALLFLLSCGGGGGNSSVAQPQSAPVPSSSSSTSSSSSSSSSSSASVSDSSSTSLKDYRINLTGINLSSNNSLAQLKLGEQTTSQGFFDNSIKYLAEKSKELLQMFLPNLIAQTSSLKPVDLSQWDSITYQFDNGTLVEIETSVKVFEADDDGYVWRSDSGYNCFYKVPSNSSSNSSADSSGSSASSASASVSVSSTSSSNSVIARNPGEDRVLYKLEDDEGNEIELYDIDGTTPVYSQDAQSCGMREIEINCDTSSLPINIVRAAPADKNGSFFAKIEYVYDFEEYADACTPVRETKNFLIKDFLVYPLGDRQIYILDAGIIEGDYGKAQKNGSILLPNDAFNASNNVLVFDRANGDDSFQLTSYEILESAAESENGILRLTQLSPSNIEVSPFSGNVVYDGQYLYISAVNQNQTTFYFLDPKEEGFTIVRPEQMAMGDWVPPQIDYPQGDNTIDVGPLNCTEIDENNPNACSRFWHLGTNFDPGSAFGTCGSTVYPSFRNNDIKFILGKNNQLLIFSSGWAHTFVPQTKTITPKVLDFPPPGLKSTLKLVDQTSACGTYKAIATDCPITAEATSDLSPNPKVDGTTSIESCMSMPNLLPGINEYKILGKFEDYIIHNTGAWNPETLINTGNIFSLPIRSVPSQNSVAGGYGSFFDFSDQYLFTVNSDKNLFTRYNLNDHSYIQVNMDDFGYITDKYDITRDAAYVEVVNSANSNAEYVKMNFADGTVEFLGTISEGQRTVIDISPINF
mgnify:CR=1 FL=1